MSYQIKSKVRGKVIQKFRECKGLSRKELAKKISPFMSKSEVDRYERGEKNINLYTFMQTMLILDSADNCQIK